MKKLVSRFMAVLMAMTMILSMSMTAFADESVATAPTGTLTVNNTVAEKKIDLYQIFTATKSEVGNVAYTLNPEYEGFFKANVNEASALTGEALSEKAYEYVKTQVGKDGKNGVNFAKAMLTWILSNTSAVDATHKTVTTETGSTEIANLACGYYVVYPLGATDTSAAPGTGQDYTSVASLVSVTDTNATVNMKSNYPTVDKKIISAQSGSGLTVGAIVDSSWEGNHELELEDENAPEDTIAPRGAADEKKAGDFAIGDTVTYQLTSKVPDMTGYNSYTFKFSDTLSKGLDLKEVLSVKVGDTVLKAGKTGDNTYLPTYTTNNDGTHTLTLNFNDFYKLYKDYTGKAITVVYTATLNKDAVIGMNPNTNSAVVEYSNNPTTGGTGTSEPSIVDVHTFDFTIYKYYLKDQNNKDDKTGLANAEFELYKANGEVAGDKVNIKKVTDGEYRVATPEEATAEGFKSDIIVSGTKGKVLVKGLDAGAYYLRETKAPDGYNKLLSDIKVVIEATYGTDGKLASYKVDYTYNKVKKEGDAITSKDNSPEVAVENKTGAQLPSTGARTALLLTLAGVVLFAFMAASSIYSKRREAR